MTKTNVSKATRIYIRNKLAWAVEAGRIKKPNKCSECGRENCFIEAHHHDYSKPYDVRWFCRSCHKKEHIKIELRQKAIEQAKKAKEKKQAKEQAEERSKKNESKNDNSQ